MGREIDTSEARCDTCGALYQLGDGLYSVATKFSEDVPDKIVSFRHSKCHVPLDVAFGQLRQRAKELDARVRDLGDDFDKLDRPEFTKKRY